MPVVTSKIPSIEDQNKPKVVSAPGSTTPAGTPAPTAPPQSLPYIQEGQLMPVIKPVKVTNTQQGNTDVLKSAQESALNAQNQPNETMGLVQKGVRGLLTNPLGYDKTKYTQNQLEQYDRNRAASMNAFQEQNADVMNSGINREKAYNFAMQGAQGRSDFENKVLMEQAEKERQSMLSALASGLDVSKTQSGLDEAAFNRLISARGAGENERSQMQGQANTIELQKLGFDQDIQKMAISQGYDLVKLEKTFGNEMARMVAQSELDTNSKTKLMELQDKIDTGQLVKSQDFEAIQKDLDRQHDTLMLNGQTEAAKQIETLKGQISAKAQSIQNEFAKTERLSTQAWQSGERISTQDYEQITNYYNQEQENARQEKDIDKDKWISDLKVKTDLQMQTQEMQQQEKIAYLVANLEEAKAQGDIERQKNIIDFQTTQQLKTMASEDNYSRGKIELQGQIEAAIKSDDRVAAETMQRSGFTFEASENAKDRALRQYETDIKNNGINIDRLRDAVDAGTISPDAYFETLKKIGLSVGVNVTAPDTSSVEKEAVKQFEQTRLQWALSHPEALIDELRPELGLSAIGMSQFNEFYNTTLYNDSEFGTSQYKPISWSNDSSTTNSKAFKNTPPTIGSFISMNGKTYKVLSDVTADNTTGGGGRLQFTVVDVSNGQNITIKAGAV